MLNSLLHNKLVLIVIILVVLGGAWYGLSSSSAGPAPVLSSAGTDTSGDQSIVSTLLALQAITLSGTIFSDPAFSTLRDFTTAIVPEPVGRPDPFAPLTAQSNATSSKSAQIFKPAK
jgi:hypothetical protein